MTMHPENQAALNALRSIATAAHKRVEHARISGERWPVVTRHEREYLNACRLVYSYEAMLRGERAA